MADASVDPGERLARARQAAEAGRLDEAMALIDAAARLAPDHPDPPHDRGVVLHMAGRIPQAEAALRQALALSPGNPRTRQALGVVLMRQGRYREGWPLYDARHEMPELGLPKPALPFPEWRGEALAGKRLLVFPEAGLGDEIQYARFAVDQASRGAEVTLLTRPHLVGLFRQSFGDRVQVLAASGEVSFPDPDYWVMSGSLAGRSAVEPQTLPSAPYLRAGPIGRRLAGSVGVATRGAPIHANDAHRSLDASSARALLALPHAVSLLPEDTGAADFAETAALVAPLDLVISVDTSIAHLAAAMGKPTWILLPAHLTDWRWMDGRDDSPWYPSARLFRQPRAGDWMSVIAAVRAELGRRAG